MGRYAAAVRKAKAANQSTPPGLGDKLAAWLARNGITQASYRAAKVRWGFADACGCDWRIANLNGLGRCVARFRRWLVKR